MECTAAEPEGYGASLSRRLSNAYYTADQTRWERNAKVLADGFCALLLAIFSAVFFGWLGGLVAFVVVEGCLLAVDWLSPARMMRLALFVDDLSQDEGAD